MWKKLLRYQDSFLNESPFESEIDDPKYFVSPHGKFDPEEELVTTWEKMNEEQTSKLNEHVQCLFPARKKWLLKVLNQKNLNPILPTVSCPEFETFKQKYLSTKVSIVFSAYYLGNPGSSFGHTLLKLSLKSNHNQSELLDYGLNSGALPTTTNPLLYSIFGLMGVFKGNFSFFPYYYKIREYNDYESRDLWTYDLNLNEEQRDFLLDHIWEIGRSYYDYYFFFENCSYEMLTILDINFENLSLTKDLHFYVIPTDTLRALSRVPELVSKINYRPSAKSTFEETWRIFQKSGGNESFQIQNLFTKLTEINNSSQISEINLLQKDENKSLLIDTIISYIDFKYAHELLDKDEKITLWRRKFLLLRGNLLVAPPELKFTEIKKHPPHLGHPSTRFTLWGGHSSTNGAILMPEWKFAFHDLLDSTLGHPLEAQIDFMKIRLRYNQKPTNNHSRIVLDETSILEVSALNPWNKFHPMSSWQASFGQKILRSRNSQDRHAFLANLGYGLTGSVNPQEHLTLSVLGHTSVGISQKIQGKYYHLGLGPKLLLRLNITDQFKILLTGLYHYEVAMKYPHFFENTLAARLSLTDSLAISVNSAWRPIDWQAELGLNYYFGP